MRKSLVTTAVATSVLALTLSACSSSGGSTSSSPPAGNSSAAGSTAAPADSGLAAAAAYIKPFLASPTTIGITQPLSKKPATGKLIVGLDSGTESAKILAHYWEQASKDLGWTYKDLNSGFTPEDQQKAMESAIQLSPAGIATSGIPVSTIQAQLAEAKSKGIWVNTSASTDQPTGAFFDTSIANPDQLHTWGKMIAAQVVTESKGKAKIQLFDLPVFPILLEFDKAFKAAITQWCAKCTVDEHPQQGADIGTKTPGAVVSAIQKAPDTNWLVFDLGDLETGVDAALQAASLSGFKIGGLTATHTNIESVKKGTQNAWTAYSLPIVGYRQIDSFARKFNGDPILSAPLPTQVITPDNVKNLVLEPKYNSYLGVQDYQSAFKTLWKV